MHLKSLTHPMDSGWIPAQLLVSALNIFSTAPVWVFSRYSGLLSSHIPQERTSKVPEGCERE